MLPNIVHVSVCVCAVAELYANLKKKNNNNKNEKLQSKITPLPMCTAHCLLIHLLRRGAAGRLAASGGNHIVGIRIGAQPFNMSSGAGEGGGGAAQIVRARI